MTGRIVTLPELGLPSGNARVRKFWPKQATAVAEGLSQPSYGGGSGGATIKPPVIPLSEEALDAAIDELIEDGL